MITKWAIDAMQTKLAQILGFLERRRPEFGKVLIQEPS